MLIWNADAAASESKVVDVEAIAFAIGSVAGPNGPLEFASLMACKTYKMGCMLRKYGVPHVLCWRTPVQDKIVLLLQGFFYKSLVEQQGGSRDYRAAVKAAVENVMGRLEEDDEIERDEPINWNEEDDELALNKWGTLNVVQFLSQDGDSLEIWLPVVRTRQPEGNAQNGQMLSLVPAITGVGVGLLLASLYAARKH